MANGYLHGVYTREVPTEILPPHRVDTNLVVAFGEVADAMFARFGMTPVFSTTCSTRPRSLLGPFP